MRNKIHDHFRRLKDKPGAVGGTDAHMKLQELPETPPEGADGGKSLELSRLSRRALEQVKAEFEESTWAAFWRVAVEGDSATDIAADLGVTKWAVYKASFATKSVQYIAAVVINKGNLDGNLVPG